MNLAKIKDDLAIAKRLTETLQVSDSFSSQKQMIKDKIVAVENGVLEIEKEQTAQVAVVDEKLNEELSENEPSPPEVVSVNSEPFDLSKFKDS